MLQVVKTSAEARALLWQAKAAAAEKPVEDVLPRLDSFEEAAVPQSDGDTKPSG